MTNAAPTPPVDDSSSNDVPAGPPIVAPELAQSATLSSSDARSRAATTRASVAVPEHAEDDASARPKRLPYNGEAEMPGYQRQEQRRWWMLGVGGALFGLGYLGSIAIGAEHDFRDGLGFAAIPLAGPWVASAMHDHRCEDGSFDCSRSSDDASLAATGVIQGVGGVLLAIGLATTRDVWVRDDIAWGLSPVVGNGRSGLQLNGAF